MEEKMDIDDYLERAYNEVSDNIKFSEAKNAALITLNSALIAWGGSIVFDSGIYFIYRVMVALFVLLLLLPLICSIISFRATTDSERGIIKKFYAYLDSKNTIPSEPQKHLYYAYIHKYYNSNPEKYINDIFSANINDIEKIYFAQIARQIVDLASTAYRKFSLFNICVKMECVIFSLGGVLSLIYLIVKCIIRIV